MAIDFCDLCNDGCVSANIGSDNMQNNWRLLVAQALCSLASGGTSSGGTPITEAAITAATLQSTYTAFASPVFITGTSLRQLRVNNTTDSGIQVSLDGGTTVFMTAEAGKDTGLLNLGNITLAPTDFQIRRVSGQTASTGVLYIQGIA